MPALLEPPDVGSNISAVFRAAPPVVTPPATRTRPSARVVQACSIRGVDIGAALRVPVLTLNNSAVAVVVLLTSPPVIRMRPSVRSAAQEPARDSSGVRYRRRSPPLLSNSLPARIRTPMDSSVTPATAVHLVVRNIRSPHKFTGILLMCHMTQRRHTSQTCVDFALGLSSKCVSGKWIRSRRARAEQWLCRTKGYRTYACLAVYTQTH